MLHVQRYHTDSMVLTHPEPWIIVTIATCLGDQSTDGTRSDREVLCTVDIPTLAATRNANRDLFLWALIARGQ